MHRLCLVLWKWAVMACATDQLADGVANEPIWARGEGRGRKERGKEGIEPSTTIYAHPPQLVVDAVGELCRRR